MTAPIASPGLGWGGSNLSRYCFGLQIFCPDDDSGGMSFGILNHAVDFTPLETGAAANRDVLFFTGIFVLG